VVADLVSIFFIPGSPLVIVRPFGSIIRTRFIAIEEPMLENAFGDAYRDCRHRVRRWP
jgi:protein-S-isoprenylcysteine O-methyltransferase Ste14